MILSLSFEMLKKLSSSEPSLRARISAMMDSPFFNLMGKVSVSPGFKILPLMVQGKGKSVLSGDSSKIFSPERYTGNGLLNPPSVLITALSVLPGTDELEIPSNVTWVSGTFPPPTLTCKGPVGECAKG